MRPSHVVATMDESTTAASVVTAAGRGGSGRVQAGPPAQSSSNLVSSEPPVNNQKEVPTLQEFGADIPIRRKNPAQTLTVRRLFERMRQVVRSRFR